MIVEITLNCEFEPTNNKLKEMTYLKLYQIVLNKEIREFVNGDLIEQEIINEFNQKLLRLNMDYFLKSYLYSKQKSPLTCPMNFSGILTS